MLFAWEDGDTWITCDVSRLYSSIPHHMGLQPVEFFLNSVSNFSVIHKEYILECLEFLLTHNLFSFDGVFYLQRCRAAMGAWFSPSLAKLYMGWWERDCILGNLNPFSFKDQVLLPVHRRFAVRLLKYCR